MPTRPINLKHLYYFWKIASYGGVARASEAIHITPQTLSGQLKLLESRLGTPLFVKSGRKLELTGAGRLALEYADEIFALGAELDQVIASMPKEPISEFRVGLTDSLSKALAFRFLQPLLSMRGRVKLVCRAAGMDQLLSQLALHELDAVISDALPSPSGAVRVQSVSLGDSPLVFVGKASLVSEHAANFPKCLNTLPILLPGKGSVLRNRINAWLDRERLHVSVAGEFDDSALMTAFGREGVGVFPIPESLLSENLSRGDLSVLGVVSGLKTQYALLYVDRHEPHPALKMLFQQVGDVSLRQEIH